MDITRIEIGLLRASKRNVRKTVPDKKAAQTEHKRLKASILAYGVLQNLVVVPTGKNYEVVAGGKRLAAVQDLVKEGTLKSDYMMPCQVIDDDGLVTEALSLAENTVRTDMHPADEIVAFRRMSEAGESATDIAAHFGLTRNHVAQRLRLAGAHSKILKAYREGDISLDILQQFCATDDTKRQLEAWKALRTGNLYAYQIREALTEGAVHGSSRLVKFVTKAAYLDAGGHITSDLFQQQTWYDDHQLLEKLAREKLEPEAETLRAEGWKWVEVGAGDPQGWNFHRARPRKGKYSEAQKKKYGCRVGIEANGKACIEKGLMTEEEHAVEVASRSPSKKGADTSPGTPAGACAVEKEDKGYSQRQTEELAIVRTNLVRAAFAQHHQLALDYLAWSTASGLLNRDAGGYRHSNNSSLDITFRSQTYRPMSYPPEWSERNDPGHENMKAQADDFSTDWVDVEDPVESFAAFQALPMAERESVLTWAVAKTLMNQLSNQGYGTRRIGEAVIGQLVAAKRLDFAEVRPTAELFWNGIPRARILAILSEVVDDELWLKSHARGLKKAELAKFAETVFTDPLNAGVPEDRLGAIYEYVIPGFEAGDLAEDD